MCRTPTPTQLNINNNLDDLAFTRSLTSLLPETKKTRLQLRTREQITLYGRLPRTSP